MFQPAEEVDGGAQMMIDNGVLKKPDVDSMLSCHLWPDIETGKVDASFGTAFASDTLIEIEIIGKGVQVEKNIRFKGDKATLWIEKDGKPFKAPFERIIIKNKEVYFDEN